MKKLLSVLLASAALISCAMPMYTNAVSVSRTSVSAPLKSAYKANATALSGKVSSNKSRNNYTRWASIVNSYLAENADGTLTRVEYISGTVYIENYSTTGELLDSKEIAPELSKFGGFYSGTDANYLVFGEDNSAENDSAEILRVVKYSKDWKRISSASVEGANTIEPFAAGSLRMAETNGSLYVYTCHKMYTYSDGLNHQANMTYVINTATMSVTDSFFKISNNTKGYVSHSFNQFIKTDGTNIFRIDHGDAHPRGIYVSKCAVGDSISNVSYEYPFAIAGQSGKNDTGVSLGGLELSENRYIIAANTIDQSTSTPNYNGQRNIILLTGSKAYGYDSEPVYLTNYSDDSGVTVRTPQLVKINDNCLAVMWEEYASSKETTKFVLIDENGSVINESTVNAPLSDCQPVTCSDGMIRWYVSSGGGVSLYAVNPDNDSDEPDLLPGDINNDKLVDATDASLVLEEYAVLSTGRESTFTDEQRAAADLNKNGNIEASDASIILGYYSYVSTGGNPDMEEWLTSSTDD